MKREKNRTNGDKNGINADKIRVCLFWCPINGTENFTTCCDKT